jgi:23S rRNA (cytosine1962-C5)-methyltransferase
MGQMHGGENSGKAGGGEVFSTANFPAAWCDGGNARNPKGWAPASRFCFLAAGESDTMAPSGPERSMIPCIIFEDEHLLVADKPAGWNTHAPSPQAGEGLYDWLRNREPRWASLAIIHRLDKETSGLMVFGKTALANRSLTGQFTRREVRKEYHFLTDRAGPHREFTAKSALIRVGDHYASRPDGEPAETRFIPGADAACAVAGPRLKLVRAQPLTGRTHQIRVHAAENGFPIWGDTLYGGTAAARVFLHAAELAFVHPATGAPVRFSSPSRFSAASRLALRQAIIDPAATTAFRLIHGASDGWPGWFVDKLGDWLLSQSESPLTPPQNEELAGLARLFSSRGVYHKILSRTVRRATTAELSPQLVLGETAPASFQILENGLSYELSFTEGYSVGLFLDQRDNRRRLLTGHVARDFLIPEIADPKFEVLNVFAYTCGFSLCAARAGARTTSLDLSKKYLEWGRRNFGLNRLDAAAHDFIFGDAFDWLRRLARKGRAFDLVVLDPPTFSQSKEQGAFRVEKDFSGLVAAALMVLKPRGILLASTNAAAWPPERFMASVESAAGAAHRRISGRQYYSQPPDFPASRAEPAYLKTGWFGLE